MPSLKDLAKECGVSVATVSKALNDQPDIAQATRERIHAAALRAISSGTAQLPPISPETPDHLIGRNTVECLNNGVMFGTAAMLDGLAARVEAELGEPLTVVATGGLAPCIMPCCTRKVIYDSDLLFKGLAILYSKNAE